VLGVTIRLGTQGHAEHVVGILLFPPLQLTENFLAVDEVALRLVNV
jgi:hypothetical protein